MGFLLNFFSKIISKIGFYEEIKKWVSKKFQKPDKILGVKNLSKCASSFFHSFAFCSLRTSCQGLRERRPPMVQTTRHGQREFLCKQSRPRQSSWWGGIPSVKFKVSLLDAAWRWQSDFWSAVKCLPWCYQVFWCLFSVSAPQKTSVTCAWFVLKVSSKFISVCSMSPRRALYKGAF